MDWVPLVGGGVDLSQQVATFGERKVRLTTKERDLLAYLARHPGRTVTRSELLVQVWGNPATGSEEPVYSTVKRLRAKIDGGAHRHLVGVHGDGYRWEPAPAATREPPSTPARGRFFGRDAELAAIDAAFAAGACLVSLVGPGGAGKTRCALELAASRSHVFCDLSAATTEAGALSAMASALGVPLEGTEPAEWVRGMGSALAAAPGRLVVIDNAEQVVEPVAAMIGAWLPIARTLLVTSREPLRLRGEHVVALGALPADDALLLLADRMGLAVAPDSNRDLYLEIVERVDRLPLAIELAAVQVHDLGARSLLDSLSAQLSTLVAGARDAPARHATLRAAVEWSWSFLGQRERDVLSDLAVFAGPFSAEAAVAVVGAEDALASLSALVRRSQVHRAGESFALYAAVRELARDNGGDRAGAATRHARYFALGAEVAVERLEGALHREAAARLAADRLELSSAFDHALRTDPVLAARIALGLDRALGLQAERSSSRRRVLACAREALSRAPARGGAADAASTKTIVCRLLYAEGNLEGAPPELLDEALALARGTPLEVDVLLARAERVIATDPAHARGQLEDALKLATGPDQAHARGRLLAFLGEVAWSLGLVPDASRHLRAALALHQAIGDRRATARTAALLAHVDRVETGGGAARTLLEQAEQAADELGDPVVAARVRLDLGQHLTRVGDQAGARAALDLAARSYERLGFVRDRAFLHLHVAETLVGIGDHDAALREALAAWTALPEDVVRSTVHEAIGCIEMLRGELAEAARWIEEGLAVAQLTGAARSECTLLGKRGLLRLARGSFEGALEDFDVATIKNEARGSVAIAGASLADRAMAAFALGRDDDARRDLHRARRMLHDPSEEQPQGRLLAACEVVGRGFGAVRRGGAPAEAHAETRRLTDRLFQRPPQEWDVPLRLLDWLIDRIASCPRSAEARGTTSG